MRLFVAVEVPKEACRAVEAATAPLRPLVPGLRWTEASGWHLTVAFLGSTPPDRLDTIRGAVAEVAAQGHPFTLRLSGRAGTFRGGVVWAGLEDAPMLAEIAGALRVRLAELGYEFGDEPFHPHLTLARAGRGEPRLEELAQRYAGPRSAWTVRHLALMRSRLAIGGARYSVTGQWPLG